MLSDLLNARVNDPTIYATGAFAGRIVGDVAIDNCSVTGNVTVENHKDNTGGFVGYTNGVTEYSRLSQVLGVLTDVLTSLLNAIPGLGLGDLITILLQNALPLSKLIPTGYLEPHIHHCTVENLSGTVGQSNTNSSGGFVGLQIGTQIENSSIKNSTYIIYASNYGGGFAGTSQTGGLADVSDVDGIKKLLDIQGGLLGAISYLIPSYTNCTVTFVDGGYVDADIAGGFVADMQSGTVDNATISTVDDSTDPQWTKIMPELYDPDAVHATGDLPKQFAVFNIASVRGRTDQGIDTTVSNSEVAVQLLKGNATKVENSSVTGIPIGYDVYGGGASYTDDGTHENGYAGGFVGYNNEGRLFNNQMIYCDVVRGYPDKVGPFAALSMLQTVYDHTAAELENNNAPGWKLI